MNRSEWLANGAPLTEGFTPRNAVVGVQWGGVDWTQISAGLPMSRAGVTLSESTALTVSAIYASVGLLAGALASLDVCVRRRRFDPVFGKISEDVPDDPLDWILNGAMSDRWSATVAKEYLAASLLLNGDAFALIHRPSLVSNAVRALEPVHPARVLVLLNTDTQRLVYRIAPEIVAGGETQVLDQADVIHIPGLGFNGFRGLSPIGYALRVAGSIAVATQDYAANFFANGSQPSYVLSSDQPYDPKGAAAIREELNKSNGGLANAHRPLILHGGLKPLPLSLSAADTQLLETRKFAVEEIARIYGIPAWMIGQTEKTSSWGSGVEQMGRSFVIYTLQRHLKKFETEFTRKLFPNGSKCVEFDTRSLTAPDIKTMADSHRTALGRAGEPGWMTVNEVRREQGLPPVPGGDDLIKATAPAASPPATGQNDAPQPAV